MTAEDESRNIGRVYMLCKKDLKSYIHAHTHIHVWWGKEKRRKEETEKENNCNFYGSNRKHS